MTALDVARWAEANQRYLMARLAAVRGRLTRCVDPANERRAEVASADELRESLPAPAALDILCDVFSLTPFERDVLLLAAGPELDSSFATHAGATFSLAMAALADPHWNAITPAAPLRHWRLLEVAAGDSLTRAPLRIDERILHYLTGLSYLDERLADLFQPQPPRDRLPDSHAPVADRLVELWRRYHPADEGTVVQLAGNDVEGRTALGAYAAAALGLTFHVLRAADVPAVVPGRENHREQIVRLWNREALLDGRALLIESADAAGSTDTTAFLERIHGRILVSGETPLCLRNRRIVRLELNRPKWNEQIELWSSVLGPLGARLDGELDTLVSQFDLGAAEIERAGLQAAAAEAREPGEPNRLWQACRVQTRGRLDDLAQRIEPTAGWDDLVLPAAQSRTLREIVTHVRHRTRVYERWGMATKAKRGLGISALFAGVSGTGKTMAAEVLARELQLDLYRIDLSQVVSKYIGETEKNLKRVFDAADAGGAVLLFDEADALFGKRSDVRDSHDRYANIEISYLLQRMESYRGLAVLTTNIQSALDDAFLRRLRFIVQFPFPDSALRASIWSRIYPDATPVANLDVDKLARLNATGGHIRNIAMHAAFLAAEAGTPVTMHHLLRAARGEYAKLDRQPSESELRGWV